MCNEANDSENDSGDNSNGSECFLKILKKPPYNVVPVMIRHISYMKFEDGLLCLWGMKFYFITFVGIVRNIIEEFRPTYEIEDETGNIEAVKLLSFSKSDPRICVNTYVRVYGSLLHGAAATVIIKKIVPLTNLNELTNHLLEVTTIMLKTERAD